MGHKVMGFLNHGYALLTSDSVHTHCLEELNKEVGDARRYALFETERQISTCDGKFKS